MIIKTRVGSFCQAYRKELKMTQTDVSIDTGYSLENISAFENGRNDNYIILMWYIRKGFPIYDYLMGGVFDI